MRLRRDRSVRLDPATIISPASAHLGSGHRSCRAPPSDLHRHSRLPGGSVTRHRLTIPRRRRGTAAASVGVIIAVKTTSPPATSEGAARKRRAVVTLRARPLLAASGLKLRTAGRWRPGGCAHVSRCRRSRPVGHCPGGRAALASRGYCARPWCDCHLRPAAGTTAARGSPGRHRPKPKLSPATSRRRNRWPAVHHLGLLHGCSAAVEGRAGIGAQRHCGCPVRDRRRSRSTVSGTR